jgi:hypothetical protein
MLLGGAAAAAAFAAPATAAAADRWSDPAFIAAASVTVHRGMSGAVWNSSSRSGHIGRFDRDDRDDRDHDRRRHRRDVDIDYVTSVYGGEWALYNNRSWEPSSYNDWWHERPDRAFPRWMQNNQACERQFWTGAGWRC